MAAKLSSEQLAANVRQRTARNCTAYRNRLVQSGKVQTLVWIPATIRRQLDGMVAQRNQNLSEVTTALLQAALSPSLPSPATSLPPVDSLPLFDAPATEDAPFDAPVDRDSQIRALKRQGLSNYAIADQVGCSEPTVRRALKKQEATG